MPALPHVCRSCARMLRRPSTPRLTPTPRRPLTLSHPARPLQPATTPHPPLSPPKPPLHIPPTSLALRWTTPPPNPTQLSHANKLFTTDPAVFLASSPYYRSLPSPLLPEVAFLGRSNVGKSSLLNALLACPAARPLCHTSSRPGRTRSINLLSVGGGGGRLVVVDMPGYGRASRTTWGTEILHYLRSRKQLRRVFLLVDGEHGLKDSDRDILQILQREGVSHQLVLSKADKVLWGPRGPSAAAMERGTARLAAVMEGVRAAVDPDAEGQRAGPPAWGEILAVSAETRVPADRSGRKEGLGIGALRWAVVRAVGLDSLVGARDRRRGGPVVRSETGSVEDETGDGGGRTKVRRTRGGEGPRV